MTQLFFEKFNHGTLAISLKRLVYLAFVLSLISDIYFSYIQIGPFPLRNYLVALCACGVTALLLIGSFKIGIKSCLFLIIHFLITAPCYAFSLFFDSEVDHLFYLKPILKFVPICISSYFFVQMTSFRHFLKVFAFVSLPNLFIGICQGLGFDFAWDLRLLVSDENTLKLLSRPTGLSYYYIAFSENLLLCFLASIFLSIKNKLYSILTFFLLVGILYNFTRTVVVAAIAVMLFLLIFRKRCVSISLSQLLIPLACSLSFFFIMSSLTSNDLNKSQRITSKPKTERARQEGGRNFESFGMDNSIGSRIHLFVASSRMIIDYLPMGMGSRFSRFTSYSEDYFLDLNIQGRQDAGTLSPHNFFINTLLKYGVFGLFGILFFLNHFHRQCISAYGLDIKVMTLLTLCTVGFHSMFHNAGFLNQPIFIYFTYSLLSGLNKSSRSEIKQEGMMRLTDF